MKYIKSREQVLESRMPKLPKDLEISSIMNMSELRTNAFSKKWIGKVTELFYPAAMTRVFQGITKYRLKITSSDGNDIGFQIHKLESEDTSHLSDMFNDAELTSSIDLKLDQYDEDDMLPDIGPEFFLQGFESVKAELLGYMQFIRHPK